MEIIDQKFSDTPNSSDIEKVNKDIASLKEGTNSLKEDIESIQELDKIYDGVDLSIKFAEEIKKYSDIWQWIKARIKAGNFAGIHVNDFIRWQTTDNEWIEDFKKEQGEQDVCLWAQGTDFDIAVLRNICYKFGIDSPLPYTSTRDHRTFIYEAARLIYNAKGESYDPSKAYDIVVDFKDIDKGAEHDPVFDCKRSIYYTWQMMRKLDCLKLDLA